MAYIADYLMRFCQWAIDNYETFNVDEEIYGDTRREYRELLDKVKAIYGRD